MAGTAMAVPPFRVCVYVCVCNLNNNNNIALPGSYQIEIESIILNLLEGIPQTLQMVAMAVPLYMRSGIICMSLHIATMSVVRLTF